MDDEHPRGGWPSDAVIDGGGLPSVLICTRDRPDEVARAVRSVLANPQTFELIVVDQSDGPETKESLEELAADTRLCYLHSMTRGKGAALNEGLRVAHGVVVLCTDDDCEVTPTWVCAMARVFEESPTSAVAFCHVDTPPYDHAAGYIPDSKQPRRVLCSIRELRGRRGLGAGMAVRREVALELGGFDELLGPGSRFMSADDMDFAVRALVRGWHVYNTGDRPVLHHGFRTLEEGREHARRNFVGLGAVCAKPLRAGRVGAIVLPIWELSHALWPPLVDVLLFRRPRGLSRITGFLTGFAGGLRVPVDREHLLFVQAGGSQTRPSLERDAER